jgi:molybdenum cofactor biosynthesis enzyme MoaA
MDNVYRLIKLNRMLQSHRIKFGAIWLAHHVRARHLFLRFDPVMACNLACSMCYFSNPEYKKQIKGMFTPEEVERLASLFFPITMQLVIGCATEPTLYKGFTDLVNLAKQYKVPHVGITTNGQLLREEHIEQLIKFKLDELTVSVHGTTKESYESFMQGASFDVLHRMFEMLDTIKKKHRSRLPHLRINYTVNSDNLPELKTFFDVFGKYDIHTLQVRPIIDFGGSYRSLLRPEDVPAYNTRVNALITECTQRHITVLANTSDPTYHEENYNSLILQAVRRHLTPQMAWRADFDYHNETYGDYCRRTGWGKYLLKSVFQNKKQVAMQNAGLWGKHSVKYEVIF